MVARYFYTCTEVILALHGSDGVTQSFGDAYSGFSSVRFPFPSALLPD